MTRKTRKKEAKESPGGTEEARVRAEVSESGSPEDGSADIESSSSESASAGGREGQHLGRRLEELEEELELVRKEAADSADRALRTLAEFDNYRRRSERERAAAAGRGAAEVLKGLLDVADNLDRALEHADGDVPQSFLEGMQLVARGLHDLLGRHDITRIESVGAPFDPEVHDALTSQPAEDAVPNTVLQEIQPGYRMGATVIRPAKVIVAQAVPSAGAAAEEDESSS